MLAADDSGLSDPFARVLITTQCQTTRVRAVLDGCWETRRGGCFFPQALCLSSRPGFSGQDIGLDCSDLGGSIELEGLRSEDLFSGADLRTNSEGGRLQ